MDSSSTFYLTLLFLMIMHILMKNNSSYGIKDCIYIYFSSIRYQIPYIISSWVTSELSLSLVCYCLSLKCAIFNKVLLSPVIRTFYYGEYHSCRDNKN